MFSYLSKIRISRGTRGTILAVVILGLGALVANQLEPTTPPLSGQRRASDGDSFHFGADRVRLLGIDAPELAQNCTQADGRSWPCGRVARTRMQKLLQGDVRCDQSERDRFGRLLGYCTSDGRDIGAIMVAEGLAIATQGYRAEQNAAKATRQGIWGGKFQNPRAWRDANPRRE